MKNFLLYLWQLPQNIVGLIVLGYLKLTDSSFKKSNEYGITHYVASSFRGGVSLGNYIIVSPFEFCDSVLHEYGHCKQSIYLGPLYLVIIGVPSIIHASFHYNMCKGKSYYHFYTEKWADKLGGVNRNL